MRLWMVVETYKAQFYVGTSKYLNRGDINEIAGTKVFVFTIGAPTFPHRTMVPFKPVLLQGFHETNL